MFQRDAKTLFSQNFVIVGCVELLEQLLWSFSSESLLYISSIRFLKGKSPIHEAKNLFLLNSVWQKSGKTGGKSFSFVSKINYKKGNFRILKCDDFKAAIRSREMWDWHIPKWFFQKEGGRKKSTMPFSVKTCQNIMNLCMFFCKSNMSRELLVVTSDIYENNIYLETES